MKNVLAAFGAILFVMVLMFAIIGSLPRSPGAAIGVKDYAPRPTTADVRYVVDCAKCSITYRRGGATEQTTIFEKKVIDFTVPRGTFLYVSAQNEYQSGGVSCAIVSGGKILERARSDGEFVIATCSARAD